MPRRRHQAPVAAFSEPIAQARRVGDLPGGWQGGEGGLPPGDYSGSHFLTNTLRW
jgi:hypothetical protein